MKKNEFREIIAKFDKFNTIYKRYHIYKKALKIEQRKLKKLEIDYLFIKNMVGISSNGDILELAIKNCFLDMGFDKVIKPKIKGEEDLRLFFDNNLIIVEITGSEKTNIKESKVLQISKWLPIRRGVFKDLNVSSLLVVNHNNLIDYKLRSNPFTKRQILLAKANGISLISTTELLNGYLLLKSGKLTLNDIKEKIQSLGLIEFK